MKAILVGQGAMGKQHLNRLSALGLSFEAVLDSNEDLDRFTVSLPSLSKSDTLVVIASPASTHASHASFFLKQGFSVFIEKPIATSAIEARELLSIKKPSQALFVGHSERYSPGFQLFQKEFPAFLPKTASLHFTRCHPYSPRCRDVNVALDLLTHDLDCFFSLFPNETDDSFDIIKSVLSKDQDQATLIIKKNLENRIPLTVEFNVNRNASFSERKIELFDNQNNIIKTFSFLDAQDPIKDTLFYEYEALFNAIQKPDSSIEKKRLESACLAVETALKITSNPSESF
jgi:hypothetical protein